MSVFWIEFLHQRENIAINAVSCKTLFLLSSGYLTGGHVMRLCHGHDESLTIPGAEQSEEEQRLVDN